MQQKRKLAAIVNADADTANAVAEAVRLTDLRVRIFTSARDMLECIQRDAVPDIIITDLHLLEIDGWRLCRLLRSPEFELTNDTPIVVTSSIFLDADLAGMTHSLGVDAHASLPCNNTVLSGIVSNLMSGATARSHPLALVVEDDRTMLKFITAGLTAYGYETLQARTRGEALTTFRGNSPDLIIVDHILEDTEGIELVPEFLATKRGGDLILIAITAIPDPELAIRYSRAGVDAYIRKPFTMPYLIGLISKAQRERALHRVEQLLEERTTNLRNAEKRFRDLYENAPVGYHTFGPEGDILSMNSTELGWLGYSAGEVVNNRTFFELQTPASAIRARVMFEELKTAGELTDVELEFVRKNGTVLPVRIQSKAVRDSAGAFVFSRTIVHDIGREKSLEQQLRHAQKMESLGIMAEGIAHNFNNLLTPILVNASDLKTDFAKDSSEHEILKDIEDAARRGATLVKQLVTLGRSADMAYGAIEPKDVIKETAGILRKTLDKGIKIETDAVDETTLILGNYGQIQQTLLNLSFNARDAMPDGGVLTISLLTSDVSDEIMSFTPPARKGKYVVISVADTGIGMSKEVQERIFDPFFTTKGLARGTGLGLSTTYAIVQDHSGFLHVYSEPGIGSRFRMYFPAADPGSQPELPHREQTPSTEHEMKRPAAPHLRGTEHILIIDDEENALRSAARILRKAGYEVLVASDGLAGLDALRQSRRFTTPPSGPDEEESRRIDLVILDVVMPGIPGEKVLQRLRGMSADLPVIVASGYGGTARVLDFLKNGAQNIISKPFEAESLLRTVRETLNAGPDSNI